jgi:hypothetical protein
MSGDAKISADDLNELLGADPVTPKGDLLCAVCDTPLSWSGKGFRPKYCPEHKASRSHRPAAESKAAPGPKASRNNAAVNRAVESLELLYGMTGTALRVTVAPALGGQVVDERVKLAESYRMLLETNARVRAWFAEVEGKAAWLPILVAHGDLAVNVLMASKVAKMAQAQAEQAAGSWPTDTDGYGVPPRPDGA